MSTPEQREARVAEIRARGWKEALPVNLDAAKGREVLGRLLARVQPESSTGCWLWTGALKGNGYAAVWVNGRGYTGHRVVYEITRGPIPKGLVLDHLCRVPRCLNPDHLEIVTNRVNILRGVSPSAGHALKTHCPRGHAYDAENTRVEGNGPQKHRRCNACHILSDHRRRGCKKEGCPCGVRPCGVEGNEVERIPALEAEIEQHAGRNEAEHQSHLDIVAVYERKVAEKDAEIARLRHVTLQKDVTAKSDCEACGGLMWIKSACPSCPNCKRPATEGPKPEPASSVSAERAALIADAEECERKAKWHDEQAE